MSKGNKKKPEEKANFSELNINQREATRFVTRSILGLVMVLLFTFVSLFVIFNFVYPASSNNTDNSHALSSSTTYYKNGSSFYTRTSATYYHCTNSRHSGTNKYTSSSSFSGTCYTYSGTCSTCGGSGSRTKSTYHSCSKTQSCSTCGGSGNSSNAGDPCPVCNGTEGRHCQLCQGTGYLVWDMKCSTCDGSGSVTCSTCDGDGYYYTYSTVSCPKTETKYASHNVSSYVEYTYTNIDTGSTTTSTSSYSTASGYTVSYNSNGGSGSMSSQYFLHGHSQALTANSFTRANYRFNGWATSTTGAVAYTDGQSLNRSSGSNMTLYANWELLSFTITLNNQGATTAGTTSVKAMNGQPMPSITVPAKTGYTFGGYYSSANGSGTQYYTASGASARACDLTGATTLYAKWTANTYTVTLNNQGATTAGSTTVSATYNASMPSITVPAKTGYAFGGYYTAVNGGGTQYYTAGGASAKNYTLTSALTLYAKWTAVSYVLTYNPNGGSISPTTQNVTYDSTYGALATPTRAGYSFDNWYTHNTLKANVNDLGSTKRIDTLDNDVWVLTNAGDLNRYFHLIMTYKGEFGFVQFNDYNMTADMYYVTTDNNGLNTIVIDYRLVSEQLSKRGENDYEKNYRFVDFEGATSMTDITVVECWLGDIITSDTKVTTAENHTVYARWIANNYNVVMNESGFAGLLSPVVGGFENTGWTGGVYDTKHVRSGKYSYKITSTDASHEFYAYSEPYPINASTKSHIFYIQFWGYQEALIPNSYCQVYWPVEEPSFGPVKMLPLREINRWNMYSFYGDRSSNKLTASTRFRIDFDSLKEQGALWLDDFMVYDLTAIFGAGNEPSKEWCDLMIMTGVTVQEFNYDRAGKLPAHRSTMTKTGQTFAGWTTTPRTTLTANKAQYADQAKVSNLTSTKGANVVMYAVWAPRAQTITTNANFADAVGVLRGGGDYHYGDKVTLRAYAKGNFVFVRWLKNGAEFDGNSQNDLEFYVVSDDRYTAVFKKASPKTDDVYVQIACQDEGVESDYGYAKYLMIVKNGESYAQMTAVSADGYKFVGWMISGTMSTTYKTDVVDIPLEKVRGKIVCAVFAKA